MALSAPAAAPEVVAKRRIEMASTFDEGAVYHKGQELPLARAEALIRSLEERFKRLAREALAALASEPGPKGPCYTCYSDPDINPSQQKRRRAGRLDNLTARLR